MGHLVHRVIIIVAAIAVAAAVAARALLGGPPPPPPATIQADPAEDLRYIREGLTILMRVAVEEVDNDQR